MATIGRIDVIRIVGKFYVIASRSFVWLMAAAAFGVAPLPVQAQWWGSRGPADFEECADLAEKAATKEAKTAALSECNAKFAGRRKPGGGYTYFDFMQNRNFDIAGPNPTPAEQKHIDEQYTVYLDNQRRSSIQAAFAAKQQQLQQAPVKQVSLNQVSLKQTSLKSEKVAVTTGSVTKPSAPVHDAKRTKTTNCTKASFSCDWPRLSEGINDLKKMLFGSSSSKDKRS
jgi:hypothetical protein